MAETDRQDCVAACSLLDQGWKLGNGISGLLYVDRAQESSTRVLAHGHFVAASLRKFGTGPDVTHAVDVDDDDDFDACEGLHVRVHFQLCVYVAVEVHDVCMVVAEMGTCKQTKRTVLVKEVVHDVRVVAGCLQVVLW